MDVVFWYQAGTQISYQCKAGVCASCEVKMGMSKVRTCQTIVKKPLFGNTITVTPLGNNGR